MKLRGDDARARKRARAKRTTQDAKANANPRGEPHQEQAETEHSSAIVPPRPDVNFPRAWRSGPILGPIEITCLRQAKRRALTLGELLDEDEDDFLRDRLAFERLRYANPIPVPSRRRPDLPIALLTASIRTDPASRPMRGGSVSLNTWLVPDGDEDED